MRLLYFIPRYDPALMGNQIHAEVIAAWRAQGVETEVITQTAGLRRPLSEVQEGIRVHRLPVSAGWGLKVANRGLDLVLHYPYLAGALLHYRRFLRTHRYDMVHVETAFPLGLVAALVPRAYGLPLAVTLPGADIMSEPEFDYGYGRFRSVRALLQVVFRRADLLRADSLQLQALAIRMGAPPEKIVAIPYNVPEDSFPSAGTDLGQLRAQCRTDVCVRHGLDPVRPIVVSLSRLHPFKGVGYLVDALPAIQRAGGVPQTVIVGPNRSTARFGDYGALLQQRAIELGVANDVHFVGAVAHDQTHRYLAAADVVVVSSVAESFNRVSVEAAAVGTPVVVTRTTGVSDYVAAHGCGLVVEPRSAPAIAEALIALLSDRAMWGALAERAPAFARSFRATTIAGELLSVYRERFRMPTNGQPTLSPPKP